MGSDRRRAEATPTPQARVRRRDSKVIRATLAIVRGAALRGKGRRRGKDRRRGR